MFLREALQRFSVLEDEVASVYALLEKAPEAPPAQVAAWAEASGSMKHRAQLLRALAELSKALDDDGPFLVQVPVQLAGLGRTIASVRGKTGPTLNAATAAACADALAAAPLDELHASLLEVFEPEVRRLLRAIDVETRRVRRRGEGARSSGASRSRDAARTRTTCAQQAS